MQNANHKKYIQLIHIAKSQFKLDEITYRTVLKELTGKTSCKDMSLAELTKVLNSFTNKGFKNFSNPYFTRSPSATQNKPKYVAVKHAVAKKIIKIWQEMHQNGQIKDGSLNALNAFVRRIINPILIKQNSQILVLNVASLDYKNATIILERLKKWQQRTTNS